MRFRRRVPLHTWLLRLRSAATTTTSESHGPSHPPRRRSALWRRTTSACQAAARLGAAAFRIHLAASGTGRRGIAVRFVDNLHYRAQSERVEYARHLCARACVRAQAVVVAAGPSRRGQPWNVSGTARLMTLCVRNASRRIMLNSMRRPPLTMSRWRVPTRFRMRRII